LGRYRNPTSPGEKVLNDKYGKEWWVEEVMEYADANRHNIHKYLSIMSDVNVQPTATNPMSGLQGMSGINSCIFGSPKVQLEMIHSIEGLEKAEVIRFGYGIEHTVFCPRSFTPP
jgi:tRNA U34 5-carboxymethylaminomethyl modifying enzyme MnmG/GidA